MAKHKEAGIARKTDIINYQQDFMTCTNELVSAGVMSEDKMSRMFEDRLLSKLCSNLHLQLEFEFPTHLPNMPYTLKELVSMLLYLAKMGILLSGDGGSGRSRSERSVVRCLVVLGCTLDFPWPLGGLRGLGDRGAAVTTGGSLYSKNSPEL